ncbi:hypothetical protein SAMN05421630_104241 [Prauserella marina]|uniref:Uncharacterized protein n=1 Tax=Prauserella marina TaxID=530584 RepID=A0A1G6Q5E9_9PSEU|nr:hypothetical protein [Prauserella marina]PWV78507.1 hypothetical protein DES30_104242 [Prauserella marina]SDC87538.1 hypothetical protein SAMN05421630_104241 [Prauserella marina]
MADAHAKGLTALRVVLGFSLLATGLHYTHNTFAIAEYPRIEWLSLGAAQILVAGGWFLFTAAGIAGYVAYTRRRYWAARGLLLLYSVSGLVSLGHFLVGPVDIPPFWFATIYLDVAAAVAVWAFVVWSAVAVGERAEALAPSP